MSSPDLSVVMPMYNAEEWVGEAIESVLARADGLLELIVVDDGSTDSGPEIAAAFGDPVRLVWQENAGPSRARNVGVGQARGALVGFLDADDIWVAESPDPRRSRFEDPAVDVVMARVLPVTGDPLEPCFEPIATSLPALLARRDVFDRFGGLDESLTHSEDLDWLTRIRAAGAMLDSIPDIVVHYRRRPGSLTQDLEATKRGVLLVARAALERRRAADAG